MKSRKGPTGYDRGGPYLLKHFELTRGRVALRQFLWAHWNGHRKGIAEAKLQTVDRGTVTVLYIIQPDSQGHWGIDVEYDRPLDPPCIATWADSLIRMPIKDATDELSQTGGLWPPDKIPKNLLADSVEEDAKLFRVILVRDGKSLPDMI